MVEIRPQPGPQEAFLSSPADIAIFGGAAGGGKTWALLLEPLRHIENPDFGAVVFRRTFPQVSQEGGMWDESAKVYPLLGATSNENDMEWRFPSGARVRFSHMQHEKNKLDWMGAQIPLICFDQLEGFTETQFFYMLSRNRSMCGIRPYVRATCNPDADSWLAPFLAWWIADDGYARLDRAGTLRWFVRVTDRLIWADTEQELQRQFPEIPPKSVTFVPASVYDNKKLLAADPGYIANLMALHRIDRERLLGDRKRGGNWKIRAEAGKVFNRAWFKIVDAAPAQGTTGRGWDMAATEAEVRGDADWTAGVKMRRAPDGRVYVLDVIHARMGPAETDQAMQNTAAQDGHVCRVRWEREGGSAGKRDQAHLTQLLAGYDVRGVPPQGDKVLRAKAFAAQAEAGNVHLVRGAWNEDYLRELHEFPDGAHDDQVDASSLVFNDLVTSAGAGGQSNYRGR